MATIKTIGDLCRFLEERRESWDDSPDNLMGPFDDQDLRVPHTDQQGNFLGYGPAQIFYDTTGLGFIIEEQPHELETRRPEAQSRAGSDSEEAGEDS